MDIDHAVVKSMRADAAVMTQEPVAHAHATIDTPVGRYALAASTAGLTHVQLAGSPKLPPAGGSASEAARRHVEAAAGALAEYFAGQRRTFDTLTLTLDGTPFEQAVWRALQTIPFGETRSYGQIAAQIGEPGAARAVGIANNRNPVGIIVPCHRVIGADGNLVGYGGGLERKAWLLAHEGARTMNLFGGR